MKTPRILLLGMAVALFAAPAFAQQEAATATLRVDAGSVMVSNGGEFVTATSGTQVPAGARVMLAEGSRATLVYPGGCSQPLSSAGVFGVPATCVAAAGSSGATTATGNTAATAAGVDVAGLGIVAGVAAVGAAGLASMDEVEYEEPPPVSR
ncbi:MAG TPA: hypothetical protein VIG97_10305 [Luteimonas sp.]